MICFARFINSNNLFYQVYKFKFICSARSGDVRKAMKGDSSWVREKANHGGELSPLSMDLYLPISWIRFIAWQVKGAGHRQSWQP